MPVLEVPEEFTLRLEDLYKQLRWPEDGPPMVGVAPGAAYGSAKRYPAAHVATLVRRLIDAGVRLTATSITGYSGGGRKLIEQYQAHPQPPRLSGPRPYGLSLAHKHVPEMMVRSALTARPIFMPIVANFYKGLVVSVPLHLSDLSKHADPKQLHDAMKERYVGERWCCKDKHAKALRC